jgi:hypothetical protein
MTATKEGAELQQVPEVIITQSGTEFLKDQIMMEQMLEQLSEARKEIDRLNAVALEKSVMFERQRLQLVTSNIHLFKLLDEMEGAFDADKKFTSPEICNDYLAAATYCDKTFGRKNNRIVEAQEWYIGLNPWELTDKI